MDSSFNRVTLPSFGDTLFFLSWAYCPKRGPGGAVHTVYLAHVLFVRAGCLFLSGVGYGLCGYTHGHVMTSRTVQAFLLTPPPPFPTSHKIFQFSRMSNMSASTPCLPPMNVSAAWRNHHIASKKWQCPFGMVLAIALIGRRLASIARVRSIRHFAALPYFSPLFHGIGWRGPPGAHGVRRPSHISMGLGRLGVSQ